MPRLDYTIWLLNSTSASVSKSLAQYFHSLLESSGNSTVRILQFDVFNAHRGVTLRGRVWATLGSTYRRSGLKRAVLRPRGRQSLNLNGKFRLLCRKIPWFFSCLLFGFRILHTRKLNWSLSRRLFLHLNELRVSGIMNPLQSSSL